ISPSLSSTAVSPARIRWSSSAIRTVVTGPPGSRLVSVGEASTHAEGPVVAAGLDLAAEQRGARAHSDGPGPPVGARRRIFADRVRNRQLEVLVAERELDVGAPAAVASAVRERLLEDPIGGAVDGRPERPPCTNGGDGNGQIGAVVLREQR